MQKISKVLKTTEAKQTTGHLKSTEFNGQIMYCALGLLGCNKNLSEFKNNSEVYSTDEIHEKILQAYNIPKWMREMDYNEIQDTVYASNLGELIYGLNDRMRMSFKEIGEYLEINLGL